ncbi:uncharacterized protein VTP21DRAFT_8370 [Calcarisporiella thermophila]|uniref:uncharacterized protein n=1 Tax=Calcarisporiella thermophila TaxID=911321 RepID=UPI0037445379
MESIHSAEMSAEEEWGETTLEKGLEGGDDFGDFDDFNNGTAGGDDFDDFTDFVATAQETNFDSTPEQVSTDTITQDTRPSILKQLNFQLDARELATEFTETLNAFYPMDMLPLDDFSHLPSGSRDRMLYLESSMKMWKKYSTDRVFYNPFSKTKGQFRWRQSHIQKAYLEALGVDVNCYTDNKPVNSPTQLKTNSSTKRKESPPPEIYKDVDIDIAKQLCAIPADELTKKSPSELNALRAELLDWTRRISGALTYWLDQREQAAMDSETYNHLIGHLLGHAQRNRVQNRRSGESWNNGMASAWRKKNSSSLGFPGLKGRKATSGQSTPSLAAASNPSASASTISISLREETDVSSASRRLSM